MKSLAMYIFLTSSLFGLSFSHAANNSNPVQWNTGIPSVSEEYYGDNPLNSIYFGAQDLLIPNRLKPEAVANSYEVLRPRNVRLYRGWEEQVQTNSRELPEKVILKNRLAVILSDSASLRTGLSSTEVLQIDVYLKSAGIQLSVASLTELADVDFSRDFASALAIEQLMYLVYEYRTNLAYLYRKSQSLDTPLPSLLSEIRASAQNRNSDSRGFRIMATALIHNTLLKRQIFEILERNPNLFSKYEMSTTLSLSQANLMVSQVEADLLPGYYASRYASTQSQIYVVQAEQKTPFKDGKHTSSVLTEGFEPTPSTYTVLPILPNGRSGPEISVIDSTVKLSLDTSDAISSIIRLEAEGLSDIRDATSTDSAHSIRSSDLSQTYSPSLALAQTRAKKCSAVAQ